MSVKNKNMTFRSKLAVGFIFVLIVIYTAYHVITLFTAEDISTIVSGVTTEHITISGDGYVFREENILYSNNAGAVDYFVYDGEKVASGQAIGRIYADSSDIDVRGYISFLDDQISLLEQCSGDSILSVDLSSLRKSADDTYFTLTKLIASGEAGELDYQIDKMMLTLSKIRSVTDGDETVISTLNMLKAEREKLFSGDYEEAVADKSGYFYSTCDGYENAFDISVVDSLDEQNFYSLITAMGSADVSKNVYGKLAPDSRWFFVLPVSTKDAANFSEESYYDLTFSEKNNTVFSMHLQKKIAAPEQKQILLVFYCNVLPENFTFERCMTAQIECSSYSGIYVPRTALKKSEGVRGVYVLRGNVVHFRCVEIVYEGTDYVLVAERNDKNGDYYYLGSNELIITNGNNLFDGRILE